MAEAANIQIKIDTSQAEKAEKVLAALQNKSDKLYTTLSKLSKGTSFDKINGAVNDTNTSFGKINKAVNGTNASMGRLRAANDSAVQSLTKVSTSSGKTAQALKGVSTSGLAVGSALSGFKGLIAGIGLAKLATDAFQTYKSFETMSASLKTVTGSSEAASSAFAMISEFAANTPNDLAQSTQAFIKLKALGLDPSREALISYGNTSAAMGKNIMQMIEAVADASTMEFERLKEFGIKATQTKTDVAFTFQGITTTVAKNSEEIQKYLLSIGNTNFATAMNDQMGTLDGKMKILSGTVSKLQIAFFEVSGAGDLAKSAVDGLTSIAKDAITWIDDLSISWTFFKHDLAVSDNTAVIMLRGIGEAINKLSDYLKPAISFLDEIILSIAGLAAGKAGIALTAGALVLVSKAIKGIGSAIRLNPIGLALTVIATGAQIIYDNWGPISQWWSEMWSDVVFAAEKALRFMNDLFPNYMALMRGAFETGMNLLQGDFEGAWESIKATMVGWGTGVADSLKTVGTDVVKGLVEGIEVGRTWLVDKITELGESLPLIVRKILGIASPSKVFIEIGEQVGAGMAIGIESGTVEVARAATAMSKAATEAFDDIMQGLAEERLDLDLGADALRYHELAQKKLTDEKIKFVIAEEKSLEALAEEKKLQEQVTGHLKDLSRYQELHNIEMTKGADAAKKASLVMDGYDASVADYIVTTESAIHMQRNFSDALIDSMSNARSIKDAFKSLGDWVLDWLKQLIVKVAAQKIMMTIGADVAGFMSAFSGAMSSIVGGVGSAEFVGPLQPATGAAAWGATAAAAFQAAIGVGAVYAGGLIAEGLVDKMGGNGEAAKIGSWIGGAFAGVLGSQIGGIIGGAFKGAWKEIGGGIIISASGGDVSGNSFTDFKQEGGLFHSDDYKRELGELRSVVKDGLNDAFATITATVTDQAKLFGVSATDAIKESFSFENVEIGSEEELAVFIENSTRAAYQAAYDNLGPEMQSIMDENVDMLLTPIEDIGAKFAELAAVIGTVQPMLDDAGLGFDQFIKSLSGEAAAAFNEDGAADAAAASTLRLVEALGGLDQATSKIAVYYDLVYTQEEQRQIAVNRAIQENEAWNLSIGRTGDQMITSGAGLQAYIEGLDRNAENYEELRAAAIEAAGGLTVLQQEIQRIQTNIDLVAGAADRFNFVFDGGAASAGDMAQAIIDLSGGMDEFGRKTDQLFTTEFFDQGYLDQLNFAQVSQDIIDTNAALGLFGDEMVTSKDGLRDYLDTLIEQGPLTAVQVALFGNLADALMNGSMTLEEFNAAVSALPPELQPVSTSLDGVDQAARDAAIGIEAAGGGIQDGGATAIAALGGVTDILDASSQAITVAGQTHQQELDGVTQGIIQSGENIQIAGTKTNEAMTLVGTSVTGLGDNAIAAGEQMVPLNEQMVINNDLVGAQITGKIQLNEIGLIGNEIELAQIANATMMNELMRARQEITLVEIANNTALNEQGLIRNEQDALRLQNITQLNPQLLLQQEYNTARLENIQLLNPQLFLQNEYENARLLAITLINGQMILQQAYEEIRLATYLLINPQLALYNEAMTLIYNNVVLMNAQMPLLNIAYDGVIEKLTMVNIQLVAFNEGLLLLGATLTTTTVELQAATLLGGESMTGLGIAITTAAGVIDTGTVAANDSMNLMALTMKTGAGDISTAAGTAKTAMDSFGQAMKDVATAASTAARIAAAGAKSASGSAIEARGFADLSKGFADSSKSYADSSRGFADSASALRSAMNNIDGSHAGGLDYVPFDGYVAKLHKGERVQTASEVRNAGGSSRSNDRSELKAIRKEIAAMRQENNELLRIVASGTNDQTVVLNKLERSNDQLGRKLAVNQR